MSIHISYGDAWGEGRARCKRQRSRHRCQNNACQAGVRSLRSPLAGRRAAGGEVFRAAISDQPFDFAQGKRSAVSYKRLRGAVESGKGRGTPGGVTYWTLQECFASSVQGLGAGFERRAKRLFQIAQKYGISHIFVFRSVARRENTSQSDVDFLVEMQEGASLFGVAGFCHETEKLLGISVDVIPLTVLSQIKDREFAWNIQREAISL